MKKVFLMCLLCLEIAARSYGQTVVFIDPAQVNSPELGAQINVSIKITNGRDVSGYNMTVSFDTTALEYVEFKNSTYLPAGCIC